MEPMNESHDRNFDANLRAMAPNLSIPPALKPEEIAAFRSAAPALRLESADPPPAKRRSRWLAFGSAMAACVAIGAVAFTLATGTRVEASTILANLRARQISGVNLTFNKLSSEGVTLDGVVQMRMLRPIAIDQIADDEGWNEGDFGAIYTRMEITTAADAPEFPNARLNVESAFSPDLGWIHIKSDEQTVNQVTQAIPQVTPFANMTRNGLLLNIGRIDPELFEQLGFPSPEDMACPPPPPGASSAPADGKRSITLSAGASAKGGPNLGVSVDGSPRSDSEAAIESLARSILSGQARQQELEQLKGYLIKANQHATVRNLGGGRYELVADLHDENAPPGAPSKATLTVNYEEQGGVQWAELSNLEHTTGSIRFEFADGQIDPALLNSDRLVVVGQTSYVDLRSILKLFGPPAGK